MEQQTWFAPVKLKLNSTHAILVTVSKNFQMPGSNGQTVPELEVFQQKLISVVAKLEFSARGAQVR